MTERSAGTACARAVLGVCLVLASASSAWAQPVVNPTQVLFTASPDHALVTAYEWGTFAVGAADPIQAVLVSKTALTAVEADWSFAFPRLLFGTFEQKLRACVASVCSTWAAADRQATVLPFAPSAVRLGAGTAAVP